MTAALAAVPALPLRGVVYCRISLDQTGEHAGVERQEAVCRELAERHGWDVAEVIVDNDVSAYSGVARPGYERLLGLIERGEIDGVLCYHSDRLYRRLRDLIHLTELLNRHPVEIRTVAAGDIDLSTASGIFSAQIFGAAGELEARRIGERVKLKFRENAKAGKAHGGGRPFGYRRVGPGELEVVPAEAELIREATERILRGASLNSIVIDWNERAIPTVNGKKWRPNSLSKLLRAGRIAGLREVGGEVLGEGTWEAILDRVTWERVRSRIIHTPTGRKPRRHLLAGMCRCLACGARMRAISGGTDKYRGRAYQCDKAISHGCGSNAAKAEAVEGIVLAHVFQVLPGINIAQVRARRTVESSAELVASIAADKEMLTIYATRAARREIPQFEYEAMAGPLRENLVEHQRSLDQLAADSDLADTAFDGVTPDSFAELDLEQQRALVRLFVDHVELRKGRPGRSFDPTRVHVVPPGAPCSCPPRG